MFNSILQTSMKFFHENSSGKILSRFSQDVGRLDNDAVNIVFCVFIVSIEYYLNLCYRLNSSESWIKSTFFFTVCNRNVHSDVSRDICQLEADNSICNFYGHPVHHTDVYGSDHPLTGENRT